VTLTVAAAPGPSTGGGGGGGGDSGGGSDTGGSTATTVLPLLTPPSLTNGSVVPIAAPVATPTQAPTPRCHVPRLRGHTVTYARKQLAVRHCAVGSIRKVTTPGVRRGRVARTLPKAGTVLRAGARVALRTAR
jgi:hypothetical protein